MIPTNLKVGDTFKDGELTYKVKKVNDDGSYVSAIATDEPKAEAPAPKKTIRKLKGEA